MTANILLAILLIGAVAIIFKLNRQLSQSRSSQIIAEENLSATKGELNRINNELSETKALLEESTKGIATLTECKIRFQSENEMLKQRHIEINQQHAAEIESITSRYEAIIKDEKERYSEALSLIAQRHEAEMKSLEERHKEILKQSEANFKVMASEIMRDQSNALSEHNQQHLGQLLTPLKNDIEKFRNDVNQAYNTESRERHSLSERIKDLIEANNNIGREAKELALALRGNSKTQGDWGELVLETILENSGLRKGEEFTIQETTASDGTTLRDETGRGLRPDVVVHYPDGRAMVIDSKVSLTAFVEYANAENEELRKQFGSQHLTSVIRHINELSAKNYQEYVGKEKLDFVMMFIPNESAYAAAMTLDPTLWNKAYEKRVLIVSPTQLVGSLRLINQLWSHDRQTRNAIEIAQKSGQMYDKFVGFVTDMERIGKSMESMKVAYDAAINKLHTGKGSLKSRAENLLKLGIKASKRLKDTAEYDDDSESD